MTLDFSHHAHNLKMHLVSRGHSSKKVQQAITGCFMIRVRDQSHLR